MSREQNPKIVELRVSVPLKTWRLFASYKGPRRLSWPEVLELAAKALLGQADAEAPTPAQEP